MLRSAKFRALAMVHAGLGSLYPGAVDMTRYSVDFSSQLRHPITVDDVHRFDLEVDGCVDRDVQLVSGNDIQVRIIEFPPPLVADYPDVQDVSAGSRLVTEKPSRF
jgi:hypothetical protein